MKRILLSVTFVGLSVVPALAGDGGSIDNTGKLLIQAVTHLAKAAGLF